MERLTYKDYFKSYLPKDTELNKGWFTKLGKLEDLEEELGIDLLTLFKALKNPNGIWYKDCEKIIRVVVLSISTMRENKFCLECYYDFKKFRIDTRDYGKTWWLEKPKKINDD